MQLQALQESSHRFEMVPSRTDEEKDLDCQTRCAVAGLHEQMNNLQAALLGYNQIIKRYPNAHQPVVGLGTLQQRMRQPLAVITTYTEAAKRNANASWPWLLLGELYESLNNTINSRMAYERAANNTESELTQTPDQPELYLQLHKLYQKLNQPDQAASVLDRMKDKAPQAFEAYQKANEQTN